MSFINTEKTLVKTISMIRTATICCAPKFVVYASNKQKRKPNRNRIQLFQLTTKIKVSIDDVEECIAATQSYKNSLDKVEYFYAHAVNYNNVIKYYDFVKRMNSIVLDENKK